MTLLAATASKTHPFIVLERNNQSKQAEMSLGVPLVDRNFKNITPATK